MRAVPDQEVGSPDLLPRTLADVGVTKDQAAEYGRLATVPDDVFEEAVTELGAETKASAETTGTKPRGLTRSGVLRKVNPEAEKRPDERWLEADRFTAACKRLTSLADAAASAVRFGQYPGDEPSIVADAVTRAWADAAAAIANVQTEYTRRNT